MAIVGRVYRDSFEKDNKKVQTLVMDIRTLSVRKKFTISVNKYKYADGNVEGVPHSGHELEPDYHVWYNFSARGESIPSTIVGNIRNMVGNNGPYKSALLFDPFISPYEIRFALFPPKGDGDVLYHVVAEPFRSASDRNTLPAAEPHTAAYDRNGRDVPVVTETIPKEQ